MAEEVAIDLKITTGEAEKNTQSLKSKLKELKQELAGLDEGSEEFQRIATEAGKVQDKIGDLNKRVNNLASDTRKLDVVVGVAQGIAGGFAAAQGAAALFGAESEDLNKALLKVQGSVALLNGVQQIANTLNKDSAVMTALNSAAQATYAFVVGTSTGALKLFRIALAATGIGLIVIAIGALVANWDKLTKAIGLSTDETEKNTAATEKNIEAQKNRAAEFDKRATEQRNKEIAAYQDLKKIREAQGLDTVELDRLIREKRLINGENETTLEIEELHKRTDLTIAGIKDREAKEIQAQKDRVAAVAKAIKDEEDRIASENAERDARGEFFVAQNEAEYQAKKEWTDKMIALAKEKATAEIDEATKSADEQKRLDEEAAANRKQNIANTFAIASASSNALAALNSLITTSENNSRNKSAKERLALEKKQFERGKALAIVNTVINTAQAIMAQMGNPTPYVGIALAALAGVTGALQIAAISAQKFEGSSGTVSQVGSVGAVDTGATNSAPTVPQTPQSIPIPQQVFVTETDITGVQGQVQVIEHLGKIQ